MNPEHIKQIAQELKFKPSQVQNVQNLIFEQECTVPFVARYRKEMTGSLDEVGIMAIRDRTKYLTELDAAKVRYLKVVETAAQSNPAIMKRLDELRKKFLACTDKQTLDDLYLPFKPKRQTKAQIAKEKGLQPLADELLAGLTTIKDTKEVAQKFAKDDLTVEEALKGAGFIFSENLNEDAEIRKFARDYLQKNGLITAQARKYKEGEKKPKNYGKYTNYYEYQEPITKATPHRVMAVRRGEQEKCLRLKITYEAAPITEHCLQSLTKGHPVSEDMSKFLTDVTGDCVNRLLGPAIETEARVQLKEKGEDSAINVFSSNLGRLLMSSPLPNQVVLGIDPGLRTGCKCAVVSSTGKFLGSEVIYPDYRDSEAAKTKLAKTIIHTSIDQFKVNFVAIGNGTGSKEISGLVSEVLKQHPNVKKMIVNESGASVYSTDDIAREEFPKLDATIRSAISIARRLQDPLAELVKIDPRSIGVGQYQHDVNVKKLNDSLGDVVVSCVNRVGVNLNTASYKLLSYVSGVGPSLAKSIVKQRDASGAFKSRDELKSIKGFGPKVFEQAAGFLRVVGGDNPLDNSAVHPERYGLVAKIAADKNKPLKEIIGTKTLGDSINLEEYVSADVGLPTIRDIIEELSKPGRDPREQGTHLEYDDNVSEISDLEIGMVLKGTVTNVTDFGAFVDVGVHQDGLVHKSEIAHRFIENTTEAIAVGDIVDVKVTEVDEKKKRISLSIKATKEAPAAPKRNFQARNKSQNNGPQRGNRPNHNRKPRSKKPEKSYSVDDLLSKFNQR